MITPQFITGALAATTLTLSVGQLKTPMSLSLFSTDGSRSIQLSIDTVHFFTPTYSFTDTSNLVLYVMSPVASIKFTGAIGDTYAIVG